MTQIPVEQLIYTRLEAAYSSRHQSGYQVAYASPSCPEQTSNRSKHGCSVSSSLPTRNRADCSSFRWAKIGL